MKKSKKSPLSEQTLVLIKPDGVKRQLIGEVIGRFERVGLKLVACKMLVIPEDLAFKHYGADEEWFENVGQKTLEFYQEHGKDPNEELGTMKAKEIGKIVQKWNVNYLTEGPVLAMIWEGFGAIEAVRKIVGSTFPDKASPGTIRGDYSFDSPFVADTEKRSVQNLIHASGKPEEAKLEIELWFKEDEIQDY